jgi:glycerol-3-phosphate acyltransferase PlsY
LESVVPVLAGMAAIVGHNWSIFLLGKGGKGVATSAGVFIALMPVHTFIAIVVFAIVFGLTKRISVGSMFSATALVLCTFILETPLAYRVVTILASLMIFVKHIPNLKRLARGEEPKVNI